MKLSMWMIANRLSLFNPEINIHADASVTLKSARRFYATDCVYVFKRNNDAVCMNEGNYLILKDIDVDQAFEIVQSVFDFYDDWYSSVQDAAYMRDYDKIIDLSWHIFHNPMLISDANFKVLAYSKKYNENDVDSEWAHITKYGYSSVAAIQYMREEVELFDFNKKNEKVYTAKYSGLTSGLSFPIHYNGINCGRIGILQKDRKINKGDEQTLEIITRLISRAMGDISEIDKKHHSIFFDLILGLDVQANELNQKLKYYNWDESDTYGIWIIRHEKNEMDDEIQHLTGNLICRQVAQCEVIMIKNSVAILYNENKISSCKLEEQLHALMECNGLVAGISLPGCKIWELHYLYRQAEFALANLAPNERFNYFYSNAIDYIICSGNEKEILHACHPDIRTLRQKEEAQGLEQIQTLQVYLNNERSLVNTAQKLYVHRNTLVYRLKKLEEEIHYDMNDVYTRDYMKISIRILNLYKK